VLKALYLALICYLSLLMIGGHSLVAQGVGVDETGLEINREAFEDRVDSLALQLRNQMAHFRNAYAQFKAGELDESSFKFYVRLSIEQIVESFFDSGLADFRESDGVKILANTMVSELNKLALSTPMDQSKHEMLEALRMALAKRWALIQSSEDYLASQRNNLINSRILGYGALPSLRYVVWPAGRYLVWPGLKFFFWDIWKRSLRMPHGIRARWRSLRLGREIRKLQSKTAKPDTQTRLKECLAEFRELNPRGAVIPDEQSRMNPWIKAGLTVGFYGASGFVLTGVIQNQTAYIPDWQAHRRELNNTIFPAIDSTL